MKKSTLFTKILLLSLLFLNACSKKDQLSPMHDPTEQNSVATFSTPLFDELNETIARFDPLYLQIVYKDKRTKSEINEEALKLLVAINQNPTSLVIQKELIDLYHFKSFVDLQAASNIISNNSTALKKSFLGQDSVLSKVKINQLNEARKTFIKNKISTLEKASQRISSGLWEDNAARISAIYHFYIQLGVLENMQGDGNENLDGAAGIGPNGCKESCCFEYQGCQINANSKLIQHLWTYVAGGAVGGAVAGFAAGTAIPGVGNVLGAAFGATYGTFFGATLGGYLVGTTGYIMASTIYINDYKVCVLNYKACIQRKNGN